jgi:hypothetical protein
MNPLGTSISNWSIVPVPGDENGVFDGMKIGRGNQSTREKPAPAPLCAPEIKHGLTWDRTRAAAVETRQLTTWATARPLVCYLFTFNHFFIGEVLVG